MALGGPIEEDEGMERPEGKRMTHRERVVSALSRKQPDKVFIDLGSTINSSMVVEGYEKLKKHFEYESENRLCNRMMRAVLMDEFVLQALDIDTRGVFIRDPSGGDRNLGRTGTGTSGDRRRRPEDG
jgi:hypothetical protein